MRNGVMLELNLAEFCVPITNSFVPYVVIIDYLNMFMKRWGWLELENFLVEFRQNFINYSNVEFMVFEDSVQQ
jgi:hypothetical protein